MLTTKIESRINVQSVDNPESPNISPDGRTVLFSGLRAAVGDLFKLDISSGDITNVTNDEFADYGPVYSPDGRFVVYLARISGSQKLFRLDLDTGKKTQLTFGTQDEAAAKFLNADTLIFSSTATDPTTPLSPEEARNGNIFNLWSLSLKTGELRQFTDALGGVLSPVVLSKDGPMPKLAFVDYYKGSYSLHTFDLKKPLHTAASADFGSRERSPTSSRRCSTRWSQRTKPRRGRSTKCSSTAVRRSTSASRAAATSSADRWCRLRTCSAISSSACMPRRCSSTRPCRSPSQTFAAVPVRAAGLLANAVLLRSAIELPLRPGARTVHQTRRCAGHTDCARRIMFGIYPFSTYRRVELSGGLVHYQEEFADPLLQDAADVSQLDNFGTRLFNSGMMVPLGASFIPGDHGLPRIRAAFGQHHAPVIEETPKLGNTLSRQTIDTDARYYMRLGANGVFAVRAVGFKSWGDSPGYMFFGGNSEMRGYDYRQFVGHKAVYANAELRFPLINAMATPIGILGGIRGVFFANIGGAGLENQSFKAWESKCETFPAETTPGGIVVRPAQRIEGFRLVDSRASYGIGLETFALGFPVHFDWSYRTLFNEAYENYLFGQGR